MMGLYKLNEFLTLEDVAEYLTDKGIYNFDLMDGIDQRKLCELIIKLHRENKITPVFYCSAIGEIHNVNFDDPVKSTITKAQINEYLILSDWGIDEVFRDNQIINIQPFDVLQTYISEIYYTGFSYHVSINDIYFPKFDLDQIFYELTNQDPLANIENLQAIVNSQAEQIAELEAQIAEQQKTIEQLTEQAAAPADDDPLFDDLHKRTQNNFVRLFIVLNELANAKKGGISLDKSYNKDHNDLINAELDRLGYSQIGEAAYKTLIDLIKEKRQKGL